MASDTTVVITSCGRQDLLEKMIDSFLEFNTYPIQEYVITEDSGNVSANDSLKEKYRNLPITWIDSPQRRGQMACIDDAYSRVKTKYIFHCEDDWEFFRPGFIEESKKILELSPAILQVWIRAENDTNNHPLEPMVYQINSGSEPLRFKKLAYHGNWNGFSLNPGLRRFSDYKLLGCFAPYRKEIFISVAYRIRLFSAVIICGEGFVRHIGWERHIPDPFQVLRPEELKDGKVLSVPMS